jgi:hypothetical protein
MARGRGSKPHAPTDSEVLEARSERAHQLMGRFLMDFWRLFAGHEVDFPYMDPDASALLRRGVAPFLASGARLRPDAGRTVPMELTLDDKDASKPAHVRLSIGDESKWEDAEGRTVRNAPRRLVVDLDLDGEITQILSVGMRVEAG